MRTQPGDKETMTVQEAKDYYKLSHRKFDALLHEEGIDFIAFYYDGRRLILRKAFETYLFAHPEIRRREKNGR